LPDLQDKYFFIFKGWTSQEAFAVYEKADGQVYVATSNGAVMGKLFGGETETLIEIVSLEVEEMLRFMNFKFTVF
jgi:hypothetical protein